MEIPFVKLHGLGNDFIFFDAMEQELNVTPEQVQHLCDRHFGIGADGVIVVKPSPRPECTAYMHYINADGTLAEMCGNGIRCFTKFLVDYGYLPQTSSSYVADTLRGPLEITYETDASGKMTVATVDMDEPIFNPDRVPTVLEATALAPNGDRVVQEAVIASPWGDWKFTCVSMGNPHAVCFIDDWNSLPRQLFATDKQSLDSFLIDVVGPFFESNDAFPAKANIEFATPKNDHLAMRVYERGCGETFACGTGTCATVVAAVLTGHGSRDCDVDLLGGTLHIHWDENTNHVFMTGPAQVAFTGTVEL